MITVFVTVKQHIYSTVPGRVGNWSCQTTMELPWVPSHGMFITFTRDNGDEYFTERVKDVFISEHGVSIILVDMVHPIGEELDEIELRGWEQLGGPWKGQTE